MRSLAANLPRIRLFKLLSECFFLLPVLIPLYTASGLGPTEVYVVQLVYTTGVMVFEVPSGWVADVLGRRPALLLGSLAHAGGLLAYALAGDFWTFALAEAVLAFGASLRSGTDTALLWDTLEALGRRDEYAAIQGRVDLTTRIGTAAGSVAGGLLALIFLTLPVWVNVSTGLLMVAVAASLAEPPRTRAPAENPFRGIGRVIRRCLAEPARLRIMGIHGVISAVGVLAVWTYLLGFEGLDSGTVVVGVVFAAFQVSSGLGARQAAPLRERLGERPVWLGFLGVGAALCLGAVLPGPLAWGATMVGYAFFWGLSGPLLMERLNEDLPGDTRATVISLSTLGGRVLYAALVPVLGRIAAVPGPHAALGLLGILGVVGVGGLLMSTLSRDTPEEREE